MQHIHIHFSNLKIVIYHVNLIQKVPADPWSLPQSPYFSLKTCKKLAPTNSETSTQKINIMYLIVFIFLSLHVKSHPHRKNIS